MNDPSIVTVHNYMSSNGRKLFDMVQPHTSLDFVSSDLESAVTAVYLNLNQTQKKISQTGNFRSRGGGRYKLFKWCLLNKYI